MEASEGKRRRRRRKPSFFSTVSTGERDGLSTLLSLTLISLSTSFLSLSFLQTTNNKKNSSIKAELAQPHPADAAATYGSSLLAGGNYRSGGQLEAPPAPSPRRQLSSTAAAPFSTDANAAGGACHESNNCRARNNYARPAGQQNVGNYLTGRPSSRVLAPPGGATSIVFGDDGGASCAAAAGVSRAAAAAAAPAPYAVEEEEEEAMAAAAQGDGDVAAAAAAQEEEEAASLDGDAPLVTAAPAVPGAPSARVNFGVSAIGQGEGGRASSKGSSVGHASSNNNYVRSEGQNVGNFLTSRPTSRVLAPPGGKSSITFG